MTDASADMLRAISGQLSQEIIPNLTSADAVERANLAVSILQFLAADIDVLPEAAQQVTPRLRQAISDALDSLPDNLLGTQLEQWSDVFKSIKPETDLACQREIRELRKLASQILRHCTDAAGDLPQGKELSAIETVIRNLGQQDFHWLTHFAEKLSQRQKAATGEDKSQQSGTQAINHELTPELVTDYLKKQFPQSPDIRGTQVVAIPGGRSKKTWFISIDGTSELPSEVVMRQDYHLHYEGTKVSDEYLPLTKLAALQLPIPKPLLLEKQPSVLGQPFMLMERATGSPPGTYFGLKQKCPGAFLDLARTIAKIHRVNPEELGLAMDTDPENSLARMLKSYQGRWRENSRKASPLIDYAFAWAQQICQQDKSLVALVHGDSGPYNMLVENDRLQLLLDWEFVQAGDPAVDLGIIRVYAEDVMEWSEFMAVYLDEGGFPVPDQRIELAMLLQYLKGACLVAVSNRNFEEGWTREFIKGGNALAGLRQIETIIANLLQRFHAI